MLELIGTRKTRSFRVVWLLEELGLDFRHSPALPHSEDIMAHTSSGKVPVLIDGGVAVSDSTAIMTYLADKHGAFTFPAGTLERAVQDSHTHFLLDEFDALIWTAARHTFVLPKEHRVPAVKDSLKWEFKRSMDRFVERLGDGPFLMGEKMTITDILACHCANWATVAKFPLDGYPMFDDYTKRLRGRPAYQRASARE